jgi:ribosomal protein S18 acetylase RimI-like enzyme
MTEFDAADVIIRPYEARDRAAVRRIAGDTANAGQPVETFFPDRELAADLLTAYYTEHEPESAWVAEQDTRVIGYLTGCRNTHRFLRFMTWRLAPPALPRAVARGVLRHPALWHFIRLNLGIWARSLFRRGPSLAAYPAHLHVNLDPALRGRQVGQRLVLRCLEEFSARQVVGIHAGVREDNHAALRFFERLGFVRLGRRPFLRTAAGTWYSIVLGKDLR